MQGRGRGRRCRNLTLFLLPPPVPCPRRRHRRPRRSLHHRHRRRTNNDSKAAVRWSPRPAPGSSPSSITPPPPAQVPRLVRPPAGRGRGGRLCPAGSGGVGGGGGAAGRGAGGRAGWGPGGRAGAGLVGEQWEGALWLSGLCCCRFTSLPHSLPPHLHPQSARPSHALAHPGCTTYRIETGARARGCVCRPSTSARVCARARKIKKRPRIFAPRFETPVVTPSHWRPPSPHPSHAQADRVADSPG